MNDYYDNGDVRARMIEFMGGDSVAHATCVYVTAGDLYASRHRQPIPTEELPLLWHNRLDISRSSWDRESLLFDLDIEYVNFDFPGETFVLPMRAFELQRPVELATKAVLLDYGIRPLHLLSGRGHHYVWRIPQDCLAFCQLSLLGHVPAKLKQLNSKAHRPNGERISPKLGSAYGGLGLVMEYLAHRIKAEAAPNCQIPVKLTAVEAGPGSHGREIISIDISEYGDPLSTRVIRVPFSYYLKPLQQAYTIGEQTAHQLLPVFLVPFQGMDLARGLEIMRDPKSVTALAGQVDTKIPNASPAVENLIADYKSSPLKKFHDWFYSESARPTKKWRKRYKTALPENLPICAQHDLEHPNDFLLRPGNIQRLARILLSLGWHPRHVSGVLQSKFDGDFDWGEQWKGYSPAMRADFYTRLFAGAFISDHDDLVDFNCQSAKEERLCSTPVCPFNLEQYKHSLLNRRKYERLARWPFNRLFLPEEHL